MNLLANIYGGMGRQTDSLKLRVETLGANEIEARSRPLEHGQLHENLAISYDYVGRPADALKLHEEPLAIRKAKFSPPTIPLPFAMAAAAVYPDLGRHAEAHAVRADVAADEGTSPRG